MKKILLLGGSAQQVIAIETAKKLGYYTVLCDFLPDNPGQYSADKFYLVSTTEKEKVLGIALAENVSGVLSYASDPAAPTAAYVAEKMGIPTNPYQSVKVLCNKDLFRTFLKNNGFSSPHFGGYDSLERFLSEVSDYHFPIIIKPVDSSGSKGITVVHRQEELEHAVKYALSFSRNHRFIVEEFIEKKHSYLIGGDIFVKNGNIVLWGLMNCHRNPKVNQLVPVGKSYPLQLEEDDINNVKRTLERLVDKLRIKSGAMNVEAMIDKENRVWLIDVGPRNGGNMIPDLLSMIFGVDVVEWSVQTAMNEECQMQSISENPYYATYNLHSDKKGTFWKVNFDNEIKPFIKKVCVYKNAGDLVDFFDNASKAIGIVFFLFDNANQMQTYLANIENYIDVVVESIKLEVVSESKSKEVAIAQCDTAFHNPVTKRKNYRELFEKIDKNAIFIVGTEVSDRIAECLGYAAMYCNNLKTREAYLTLIAVRPEYQRKHIGEKILHGCEKIAWQNGMESIRLEVHKSNKAALNFYERAGFRSIDQDSQDSLFLVKRLQGEEIK